MKSEILRVALESGHNTLTEPEAKALCREYAIPVPQFEIAHSQAEVRRQSEELVFPIVAKIVSRDIVHKTEAGGVVLGIKTPEEAEKAFSEITARAKAHSPDATIEGVLLERMQEKGVELIVGATKDPQFGETLLFGAGGILVELMRDVTFKLAPITTTDARNMLGEIRSEKLLSGFRGSIPVNREVLIKILEAVSRMVTENPEITELDLNPVIANENDAVAVDARVVLSTSKKQETTIRQSTEQLAYLFKPRSVAVVGASTTPGKIGHEVFKNLAKYDYKGSVYPINPSSDAVLGVKAYASILDVPGQVDLAVLTIPSKITATIVDECGRKGVKDVVIVSGGFKEAGLGDVERQTVEAARKYGIRIVGPNCIGVFDGHSRLDTFFQSHDRMVRPRAGSVSFITQSGTFGATILEWAAESNIGISKFVSYGNRCDVDEGDLIEFFGNDPDTRLIGVYVEGLDDGRKLYDATRKVTGAKPIVVLKAGRTNLGSKAAKSHTGWLAGSYEIAEAAFRQAGMVVASDLEDFFDKIKALNTQPLPTNAGLVMLTNGAGPCVMAADRIERAGLSLATLSASTKAKLTSSLPSYCLVSDTTIDLTGSATSKDYHTALTALAADPNIGVLMPFFVFQDTPLEEKIVTILGQIAKLGKSMVVCASGGPYTREMSKRVEALGIPVYETGERAVGAVEALIRQAQVSGKIMLGV
jgi:3-hydroxypropionyl-CoA synthetase (ADP-forming)